PEPTYVLSLDKTNLDVTYRIASRLATQERLIAFGLLGYDAPYIWTVVQEKITCTGTSLRVRQSVLPTMTIYVNGKQVTHQKGTKLGGFTRRGGVLLHGVGFGVLAPFCKPSFSMTVGKAPRIPLPRCA